MAKISDFVGLIRDGGLALTSHYTTVLNLPENLLTSPYVEKKNKIITFCDQVQIPGVSFSSSQVRSYGEFREVPYEKIYEPINISFYSDNKMIIKNLFDDWINLIQDTNTRDYNYPSMYLSDKILIYVEDSQDRVNYEVSLMECYPKSIGAISLNYSSKEIMKISVNMVYKYFTYRRTNYSSSQVSSSTFVDEFTDNTFTYGYDLRQYIPLVQEKFLSGDFSRVYSSIDGARDIVGGIQRMSDVFTI